MTSHPHSRGQIFLLAAFLMASYFTHGEAIKPAFLANLKNPPKNYVANGSFSRDLEGWHFFKKRGGAVVQEGPNAESCFKISGSFDDYVYLYNLGTDNGWNINLKEGKTYTLSVSFRAENLTNIDVNKIIHVPNYGWTKAVAIGPGATTTKGWTRKSITFKAPAQTRAHDETAGDYSLLLFWPHKAGGTLWVDEIQVEDGAKETAYSDLHNFEIMSAAKQLQKLHSQARQTLDELEKKFSHSNAAKELKRRLTLNRDQVEKLGGELANLQEMTVARLRRGKERMAMVGDELAAVMCPLWIKNPYLMARETDLPESLTPLGPQRLKCYVNETKNVGLMITNLSGRNIDARVAPLVFLHEESQTILAAKRVVKIYTAPFIRGRLAKEERFTDPLPEANAMGHLAIPAGESRQALLSFSTRGLPAGVYRGTISFDPLANKTLAQKIKIEMEVLPVRLPDRVPVDVGAFGSHFLRPEEALRLGHNVVFLHLSSVFPTIDEKGVLQRIDFTHLDRKIKSARTVVPDCKFMMVFSIGMRFIDAANRLGIKWPDARLKNAWQAWVKNLCAHLVAVGVDHDQFLLQVVDEPGPAEAIKAAELQNLAKAAAPKIRLVSFLTGFDPNPKHYDTFYGGLDYVGPIVRAIRDEKCAAYFRARGKQVAVYDCYGTSETLNPVTYYRLMPWRAWHQNLAGWYYWYRDDRAPNWSSAKQMSTVYPVREGNSDFTGTPMWPEDTYVISRRWLAMEAGVLDYKALVLLRQALDEAQKTPGADAIARQATKDFLKKAPTKALALDDPAKYPRAMAVNAAPDILDQMRERMAELTAALLQAGEIEVVIAPRIDAKGVLKFETRSPSVTSVNYLTDGQLPWREIDATKFVRKHVVPLRTAKGTTVTKCNIQVYDRSGRIITLSPFIVAKVSVDSVFPGYNMECLIDGERVPGAQYWRGKTWISQSKKTDHWVQLDWAEPCEVSRMNLCWMTFGGLPTAYKIQYRQKNSATDSWTDIGPAWREAATAYEVIDFTPVRTNSIRVLQRSDGGNHLTPTMMGLSEIEILAPIGHHK